MHVRYMVHTHTCGHTRAHKIVAHTYKCTSATGTRFVSDSWSYRCFNNRDGHRIKAFFNTIMTAVNVTRDGLECNTSAHIRSFLQHFILILFYFQSPQLIRVVCLDYGYNAGGRCCCLTIYSYITLEFYFRISKW